MFSVSSKRRMLRSTTTARGESTAIGELAPSRNHRLHVSSAAARLSCNRTLREDVMELGTIERELYIEATPEIVFEVVSDPAHVKEWWPDEARYEAVVGAAGEILFADADGGKVEALTVVELDPPHRFSFRWTHPAGEQAAEGNSLLVTFELVAQGEGTLVRFRETGFRERGWEAAVLEATYQDHVHGWDYFLPRLVEYAATLDARPR
jgi:uncharacterized protein YndB with AHSA1/START domain